MHPAARAAAVVALLVVVVSLTPALAGRTAPASATPTPERVAGSDRVATAVAVSRATHQAAQAAVLARADVPADALAGAPLARFRDGPLLLAHRDHVPAAVLDELARLGVEEVVLLGGRQALGPGVEDDLPDGVTTTRIAGPDRVATALAIADRLPPTQRAFAVTADGFADAVAVGPLAAARGDAILLVGDDPEPVTSWLDGRDVTDVVVAGGTAAIDRSTARALAGDDRRTVTRVAGTDRYDTAARLADMAIAEGADPADVWIATGAAAPDSLTAGPAVAATGGTLLLLDGAVPWATRPATERLRSWSPSRVRVLGGAAAVSADLAWQLPAVLTAPRYPDGGLVPFPGHRMVAFYGHHSAPSMGVLGEQPPDEAYERLAAQAAPYGADGRTVLPVFELIVSVAQASAGADGDYSAPSTPDQIQPWLDAARRHDAVLLLDLQPGRTDFLTEARRYESFLRQPDVGLALDPEWRMHGDQVPAQVVGHVDAAEVNAVSTWLADIVREEALPQKLFVVHQFQMQMIRDRENLALRPELATVIQMDGQGSRAAKLDTYRAITRTAGPWHHGFKLFYDEDPDMFAPPEALDLTPRPDFVSYQ